MVVASSYPSITKIQAISSKAMTIILCAMLATTAACAQFTAAVQGNVRDAGGANIPNAQMLLLNTATKVQQSGTSDASGLYRFTNLGPGDYEISSSANGFQRTQSQFTLTAGENRDVSLVLAVGSDTTSIVVISQAPLLDTGDSREELTLNQAALENLPLATRNPISLVGLTPGVTGIQTPTTNFNPETTNHYSANGKGGNANTFIVDGLDIDSDIGEGVDNLTPNIDSLSEVTVQTNTYNVDYGKSSSIETLYTSRAGTTEYHGFASGYYTYQGLEARGEYGVPQPTRLSPFHTTNLSFGVGGPIIPKRRFFFFATLEPYFSSTPNPALTAVGALAPNSGSLTYEDPAFTAFAQQVKPNSLETSLFTQYPTKVWSSYRLRTHRRSSDHKILLQTPAVTHPAPTTSPVPRPSLIQVSSTPLRQIPRFNTVSASTKYSTRIGSMASSSATPSRTQRRAPGHSSQPAAIFIHSRCKETKPIRFPVTS